MALMETAAAISFFFSFLLHISTAFCSFFFGREFNITFFFFGNIHSEGIVNDGLCVRPNPVIFIKIHSSLSLARVCSRELYTYTRSTNAKKNTKIEHYFIDYRSISVNISLPSFIPFLRTALVCFALDCLCAFFATVFYESIC